MKFVKAISPTVRAALLTGVMIGTSYIPFPPWALFFAWVPLWLVWSRETSLKKIFWSGWLAQFVFTLIGFHWIGHTVVVFGHLPKAVGFFVLIGFASYANLHVPLAGVVWKKLFPQTTGLSILALASISAVFQLLFPQIFLWHMGYPWLWAKLPAAQFADLVGFEGLSVITFLINGYLMWVWWKFKGREKKNQIALVVLAFIIFNFIGWFYGRTIPEPDQKIKILVVQANIGNFEKFMAEKNSDFRTPITQKFYELTLRGLSQNSDVDLIMWPETAFPANLHESLLGNFHQNQLRTFIMSQKKPLLTGGYFDDPVTGQYYNSLFYFGTDAAIQASYDKSHLLAFGEYFPGADYFPFLKNLIPEISDFGRGPGPTVMIGDGRRLGPQICYEGLFPDFVRKTSQKGAQIFVNVTNDSWFMHTFESYQHLYMTLARAVEFRRPLVRATNTGISSAITAKGKVLLHSPQETEWFGVVELPYLEEPPTTVYSSFGYYFAYVLTVLLTLGSWIVIHARKS